MSVLKPFKTIPEMFEYVTTDFGKTQTKPAIRHKYDKEYIDISYTEFYDKSETFALGLAAMGVKRNDKIAIIGENRPEWVYADMAILGLGATDVPLYPISTADTIQFILNNSESVGIIVSTKFQLNKILKVRAQCKFLKFIIVMNELEEKPEKDIFNFSEIYEKGKEYKLENPNLFKESCLVTTEDDICTIIYTSGTTGEPKGVVLTHKNIVSNVLAAQELFDFGPEDSFLSFLPLCHIFERMAGYYTALSGGSTIAYAEGIEKIASNMMEIKPTIMTAVPRLFERIYSKIKKNVDSQPEEKNKKYLTGLLMLV
jgi:long-chain acyl-CoA synthetase